MSELSVKEYMANGGAANESFSNFWDWFCRESSLKNRGIALDKKVNQLIKLGVIDPDSMKVSYKNCCPLYGNSYDIILVQKVDSDEDVVWIEPSSGHESNKGVASAYNYSNGKSYEFANWSDMKKQLKENSKSIIGL